MPIFFAQKGQRAVLKAVTGVALLMVILVGLATSGALSNTQNDKASYVMAPIERGDIRSTLSATGSLNALVTVKVGSQLSGQISELLVDFNDKVVQGQVIATLDSSTFASQVRQAEAALDIARATAAVARAALDKSTVEVVTSAKGIAAATARVKAANVRAGDRKRDLERKSTLANRATLPQSAAERAEAEYEAAVAMMQETEAQNAVGESTRAAAELAREMAAANVELSDAQVRQQAETLEQARIALERSIIRSPIDGIVISRDVDPGQTVAATLEAPTLFTIAHDLGRMQVHARVDEADIGRIKEGQRAMFTVDAHPARTFNGIVSEIRKAPLLVQNVVTYTVVLEAENPDLVLLPGMTAVLQVIVKDATNVLKIPNAALRFTPTEAARGNPSSEATKPQGGNVATVWTVGEGGQPVPVEIGLGQSDDNTTEVVHGALEAGQQVIVGTDFSEERTSLLSWALLPWGLLPWGS
jgi:HlyD family secretion protein